MSSDVGQWASAEGQISAVVGNAAGGSVMEEMSDKWPRIQARMRAKVGDDVFSSWFGRLEMAGVADGAVNLTVPTRFLKNWLELHYMESMLEVCKIEIKGTRLVTISVREAVASAGRRPADVAEQPEPTAKQPRPVNPMPAIMKRPVLEIGARPEVDSLNGASLDRRFTFDSFIVGGSNRLAHAAANQVAETALTEPIRFNPLYIHSAVGLGKSHLLQAIAWEVKSRQPHAQIVYMTADLFRYRLVEAIKKEDALNFKEWLRNIDLLLIDDMQYLHGERTEQEFEHTFNALFDNARQIVVAADRAPVNLQSLDQRMRSRLSGGLITEISPLDYDLRLKILERRLAERRSADPTFAVPPEVLEFLAERLTESGRELDGAINRLYAGCHMAGLPITLETVEPIIRDLIRNQEHKRVKIEDIQRMICKHYGVSRTDILSPRRHRSIVWPRQVGMYLAKTMTQRSLPEIGRRFGNRDHTTVLHAIRKIESELEGNTRLRAELEDLKKLLNG
ncbi:MAG: chromosomal replication initiator protein DnaA [Hyphomicrobiaceae bacterium]